MDKRYIKSRKPMRTSQCQMESVTHKIYVAHLEEGKSIYLFSKFTFDKIKKQGRCTIEIMSKEEAKCYKRVNGKYAIRITNQQFEEIMALFRGSDKLYRYFTKNKLIKNIELSLREYL